MKRLLSILVLSLTMTISMCQAQRITISTNLCDYLNLATLNLDAGIALNRHWSLNLGAKYNPFSFSKSSDGSIGQYQCRQQSYAIATRFWLWHVWSGWWCSGKLRYQEYNIGGFRSPQTEEGDRLGIGLSAGYAIMLSSRFNLDLGLGFWSGWGKYTQYSCPRCGLTIKNGSRIFILPDDILISLVYVF